MALPSVQTGGVRFSVAVASGVGVLEADGSAAP